MTTRHATPADYARLGVPVGATAAEVKSAFRRLALLHHPDHNSDPDAPKRFKEIAESYAAALNGPAPRTPARPVAPAGPARPGPRRPGTGPADPHDQPPMRPAYSPAAQRQKTAAAPRPKPLADMNPGETLWADYAAVLVGPDRSCSLDPSAAGRPYVDGGNQVRIERNNGGFHVEIPGHCRHRWSISPRAASGLSVTSLRVGGGWGADAVLPAHLLDSTVARMAAGARGFTVATALVVTADGRVLVDGSEQVSPSPTLTTPVRVERHHDGLHVVAPGTPQQWLGQQRVPGPLHIEVTSAVLGGVPVGSRAAAQA